MPTRAAAIIVAGGSSTRMNGIDKVFAPIMRKPVIAHTIEAFERAKSIEGIIIVARKDLVERCMKLAKTMGYKKVRSVCAGGPRRQDSTLNGLREAYAYDVVAVHDAARPCVSAETIDGCVAGAERYGGMVAASPVSDTIKSVNADLEITATVDRSALMAMHTPQAFRRSVLMQAYEHGNDDATDEATLAERAGFRVRVYIDSTDNIKITNPPDLDIAEAILHRALNPLPPE